MKKFSSPDLHRAKAAKQQITALTAYDFTTASLIDQSGIDLILVGDSLSSFVQGYKNTLAVTLDEMIYHARCVSRGVSRAFVIGDLPFMSYQVSPEQALISAGRMIKEAGVDSVKLEGGEVVAAAIRKIVSAEIPVIGHIGLTPQSYLRMGGHKVQGRNNGSASRSRDAVLNDALAVQDAGAVAVVLEGIPSELAAEVTHSLEIPTIGIGAGIECDGQILVTTDMLGLSLSPAAKFVKQYAALADAAKVAITQYREEVLNRSFPTAQFSYSDPILAKILAA